MNNILDHSFQGCMPVKPTASMKLALEKQKGG
jgi:hypothetical protein